jgi:hypothetical protein
MVTFSTRICLVDVEFHHETIVFSGYVGVEAGESCLPDASMIACPSICDTVVMIPSIIHEGLCRLHALWSNEAAHIRLSLPIFC